MHLLLRNRKILPALLVLFFCVLPLTAHAEFTLQGAIIAIPGFFLYLAGTAFDSATNAFVLQMGGLITGSNSLGIGLGISIDKVWTIVRDIVNLTFIFGLVYVGFKTILNADTNTKKMLASIIIGALLVNFSLYISKVVIDVSNVTASEIYNNMGLEKFSNANTRLPELGIAGAFMSQMGVMNLIAVPNIKGDPTFVRSFGGDASITFAFGAAVVMLVATFVFLAGAILLTIRFGVLVILMMLSPIAFAATVFPGVEGWAKKWWQTLFNQAFFAPAYFFMLYITLTLAGSFVSKTSQFDKIFTVQGSLANEGANALVFFALIIVLLVASLIVAKQMGALGASRAMSFGKNLGNTARGIAGRNTIGRVSDAWAQRREEAGKSSTSTLSRIASAGAGSKFGGSFSRVQIRESDEKAERKRAQNEQAGAVTAAIAAGIKGTPTTDQQIDMERKIAGASTDQLVGILQDNKPTSNEYKAVIRNMSASQFDAVMKSKPEDLDDNAKAAIAKARHEAIRGIVMQTGKDAKNAAAPVGTRPGDILSEKEALREGIKKASAAQLKVLGSQTIIDNAADLSQSQIDDIKKSDFTETEKARILETRDRELINRFQAQPAGFFSKMREADVAELPKAILTDSYAVPEFTPGILSAIRPKLNPTERKKIRTEIEAGAGTRAAEDWLEKSPRGMEF